MKVGNFWNFFLRVEKWSRLKDFLSWVLTYWTRDITCSRTRHIRLQPRLIPKDSIKIFIYHITRADFYLNASSRNFDKTAKSPQSVHRKSKFSDIFHFWQCVRSMWKLGFDLSRTLRKMFIGGSQDALSRANIGCHKDATSIIHLWAANKNFSANFV